MGSVDLPGVNSGVPHAVLFPFMSKGHTIPLLHLARLLLNRNLAVTIVTTPLNLPFISSTLADTPIDFTIIPFPKNIENIPENVESTDMLPSMSLFLPFVTSTKLMKPDFDKVLASFPRVDFLVSDGFFAWTYDSATSLGIKRVVSYGMCAYAGSVQRDMFPELMSGRHKHRKLDDLFTVPSFPRTKVCRNDFNDPWNRPTPSGPLFDYLMDVIVASSKSFAILFNSFNELESDFVDYWAKNCKPKPFCVGPLCLAEPIKPQSEKSIWIQWLDLDAVESSPVLYAAFGSQATLPENQLLELARGLEMSGEKFLWVLNSKDFKRLEIMDPGFQTRVEGRGLIVSAWVNQREILNHEAVKGFLSHCGWNSVVESLCAGVPILAWPMMAEQHLNARMVAEELLVGLRVDTVDGSVRGFVAAEGVAKGVRRLLGDEEVRRRVVEVKERAEDAVAEGGSSWKALNELIDEACNMSDLDT